MSHDAAVQVVSRATNASSAARRLRDLAVGYGCKTDVSVIVVQLNVGDGVVGPEESLVHSVSEPVSDQGPGNDVEFTNIDDILSDAEDDVEQRPESTWNGVKLRKKNISPHSDKVDIDRLILDAISSPPTSQISPEMKSTNIDDILSSPSPPPPPHHAHSTPHHPHNVHSSHITNGTTATPMRGGGGGGGGGRGGDNQGRTGRKTAVVPIHPPPSQTTLTYPAQTIPRDAAASRTKGGDVPPPLPPSQAINYEQFRDSFEVTQSSPLIPANQPNHAPNHAPRGGDGIVGRAVENDVIGFGGSLRREEKGARGRNVRERGLRGNLMRAEVRGRVGAGENMESYLDVLNQAMTELDADANPSEPQFGGKLQRRLSYVEHSYKQLTNDVYGEEGEHVNHEDELDDW